MTDIREEFEEYIAGVRERVEARGFEPLGDAVEKWMFHAWQASRAALKVELPEKLSRREAFECGGIAQEQFATGWNYHADETKKALQQAGIEVK